MPREYDHTKNHFGNVTTVKGSNNRAETFNYGSNAYNNYDHDPRHYGGEDPGRGSLGYGTATPHDYQTGRNDRSRARTSEEYSHRTTNHFGNVTNVDGYDNVAPTFNYGSNAYHNYGSRHHHSREDHPERGSYVPEPPRRSSRPPESVVVQRDHQHTDRSARSDRSSARMNQEYHPMQYQTTNQFGNVTEVGGNNNEAPTYNYGSNAYTNYEPDQRHHSGERSSSGTVQQRRSTQPPGSVVPQHQTNGVVRSSRTRSTDEYPVRRSQQAIEGAPVYAPPIPTRSTPSYAPSNYSDSNSRRAGVTRKT